MSLKYVSSTTHLPDFSIHNKNIPRYINSVTKMAHSKRSFSMFCEKTFNITCTDIMSIQQKLQCMPPP
jgi:hypothetical protein